MPGATDFLENALGDFLLRSRASFITKPTSLGLGLWSTDPTDTTSGGSEFSLGNYLRATLTPSDTNFVGTHGLTTGNSTGTSGVFVNAVDIAFGTPNVDWGTAAYFVLFHNDGTRLITGQIATPVSCVAGQPVLFRAGQLSFTFG